MPPAARLTDGCGPKVHRRVDPHIAGESSTGIAERGRPSLGKALLETGETLPTSGSLRYSQAAETTVRRVKAVSGSLRRARHRRALRN